MSRPSKQEAASYRSSVLTRIYRTLDDDELAETIAKIANTVARLDAGEGPHISLRQRDTYRESLAYARQEQERRRT